MRTKHSVVIVIVLAWSCPAPLSAQDGPDARRAQAKEAFETGREAFAEDDYEAALQHFGRAFELRPHDAIRFNIGICLERLGRFREAMQQYERAADSEELDGEARERARKLAERVRGRLGTLRVEGSPAGALVVVDGEELCRLPCAVSVDPGDHDLVLRDDGGVVSRRGAHVSRGGSTTVRFDGGTDSEQGAKAEEQSPAPATMSDADRSREELTAPSRALAWTGGALALAGAAGALGFGLRTKALHDTNSTTPTTDNWKQGVRMRRLTNASIGVMALGATLVALDLLLSGEGGESPPSHGSAMSVGFRF